MPRSAMQSIVGIPHARPYPVWIGFVLCGVIFAAEVFDGMTHPSGTQWYFYLTWVIAFIYYLMCVYRFHRILAEVTFGAYSIKPAEAVYSHLIPLLNIYWLFAWPTRFADYVNAEHALKVVPGAVIGTILLASAAVARFFDSSIGMAGYFGVMVYLTNRLNQYASYRDLDVAAEQLAQGGQ
jgi:hypothetical protein